MSTCIKKPIKAKGSHEDVSCSKCEFHESSVWRFAGDMFPGTKLNRFFCKWQWRGEWGGGGKTRLERGKLDPPKIIYMKKKTTRVKLNKGRGIGPLTLFDHVSVVTMGGGPLACRVLSLRINDLRGLATRHTSFNQTLSPYWQKQK